MATRPGYIWSGTEWIDIGQSAVVSPFKYQASQPSSPSTGDIWIDSDEDVPSVDSTLYYRWTKTMSGGETSLSGTDNNSLSLQYTPGYESVFINGVLQARNLDYTATSGSSIAGLTALVANDIVMVESIVAYSVGDTYTQETLNTTFATERSGSVLQVVQGTTSTVVSNTTSTPALTGLNVTFTPKYTNSKLLFTYSVNGLYTSTSGLGIALALRTGNTANAGTALIQSTVSQQYDGSDTVGSHSTSYLYTPPSVMSGSQTFSVQFHIGQGSGTVYCQSSSATSTLIVQEIGA